MRETELARVLLVRACEESDLKGRFLPVGARERASRAARAPEDGDEAAFLLRRAEALADALAHDHPALTLAPRLAALQLPTLPFLAAAFAAGIALDTLGPARRINLLAFPLLGLLVWNGAVYTAQLLRTLRVAARSPEQGLGARLARAGLWLASRRGDRDTGSEAGAFRARALRRFGELWVGHSGGLLQARAKAVAHAGAAAFAAGIVASMYVGGFAFEYRASWESTFLDAAQVQRLLGLVLGPASAVLGIPLPDVAGIQALRSPASSEAAAWIHLWGLTALAVVGLPRAGLGLASALRARRLATGLAPDLTSPYALRLLAASRGGGARVEVLRYSTELSPRASETLRDLLFELFGNRADVVFVETLRYGDEPPEPGAAPCQARVVVFNLAQSPEQEVHGAFVEACKTRTRDGGGVGQLLVLLDEEAYQRSASEERVAERRRSWTRVLREVDLSPASLPAPAEPGDAALAAARQALWPTAAGSTA